MILDVSALHKAFGHLEVLKGVDLRVDPGELVFVIGPSGAGKSTLLRCCNRLEEPTSGSIKVEGVDILAPGVDINAIRRRIGMVFQSFNLYPHLDALGNVTLALQRVLRKSRPEAKHIGLAALERVGLAEKAKAYPSELSGGQQQRVAIARALALEPAILMFDEPTSALDPELVGSVLKVMRELRESGMTMVVVSHEMRFARSAADRVLFMDQGRILEEGPPQKIFNSPEHQRVRVRQRTLGPAGDQHGRGQRLHQRAEPLRDAGRPAVEAGDQQRTGCAGEPSGCRVERAGIRGRQAIRSARRREGQRRLPRDLVRDLQMDRATWLRGGQPRRVGDPVRR